MSNSNKFSSSNSIYIYVSILLTSMSIFIYETLLTRMFSAILTHSLVFIIVSLAILGGGIGSIITFIFTKKYKSDSNALLWSAILLP